MNGKWIGAILVLLCCGGCGFSVASSYRKEEKMYHDLIRIFTYMKTDLQYRLTTLPELCSYVGQGSFGCMGAVFKKFAEELCAWTCPDTASCLRAVLEKEGTLPLAVKNILVELGEVLGRFDMEGQIQGLNMVKADCENALNTLLMQREERIRGYQTLGLCAGAAIVVLFV